MAEERDKMENEVNDLEEMTATEMVKKGVKKGVKNTTRKPWFKRLIAFFLTFCLGFGLGFYRRHKSTAISPISTVPVSAVVSAPAEKPFVLTVNHIEEILSLASDLITTKYVYTDADTYEDYKQFFNVRLPFTTNKVVFTYSGELGIGIDLSKLSVYLDNENKAITISLPKIDVKYNEIDAESFEYYNVSTTIFNQLKMEDVSDLIATLIEKKEEQVLNDKKVMEEAYSNTEVVLRNLLSNSNFTRDYKVIFK